MMPERDAANCVTPAAACMHAWFDVSLSLPLPLVSRMRERERSAFWHSLRREIYGFDRRGERQTLFPVCLTLIRALISSFGQFA